MNTLSRIAHSMMIISCFALIVYLLTVEKTDQDLVQTKSPAITIGDNQSKLVINGHVLITYNR